MSVTASEAHGGIANTGYWGLILEQGVSYHFSVYLKGDSGIEVRTVITVCQLYTLAFVPQTRLWER